LRVELLRLLHGSSGRGDSRLKMTAIMVAGGTLWHLTEIDVAAGINFCMLMHHQLTSHASSSHGEGSAPGERALDVTNRLLSPWHCTSDQIEFDQTAF